MIIFVIVSILLFPLFHISTIGKNINDNFNKSFPQEITVFKNNNPPEIPAKPEGPSYGEVGHKYFFETKANDSDGNQLRYGWDFTGDKVVDKWTSFGPCNQTRSCYWEFWFAGVNNISVKAEDEHGLQSNFSEIFRIYINNHPNKPKTPWGVQTVTRYINTTFYSISQDMDGDQLWYQWFTGGCLISDWIGPYNSSEVCNITVYWEYLGDYEVKVICKDNYNSTSECSESLEVNVIDPIKIQISALNIGTINVCIKNQAKENLINLSWSISVYRDRILRNINISNNGTLDKIYHSKSQVINLDKKIVRKFGFIKIKVRIFIDEIVEVPYEKNETKFGFILGRIIIVI